MVTEGYFPAGVTQSQIDTVPDLLALIGSFTVVNSAVPGSFSPTLGGAFPGYVDQSTFATIDLVTPTSPLFGRTIYSIITTAATVGSMTPSDQVGLIAIGTIHEDAPLEYQYFSMSGTVPIIGRTGTWVGDAGGGYGTYRTFDLMPEPTYAILTAVGTLTFLLRRRIRY